MIGNLSFKNNSVYYNCDINKQNNVVQNGTTTSDLSSKNLIEKYLENQGNIGNSIVKTKSNSNRCSTLEEFRKLSELELYKDLLFTNYGYKFRNKNEFNQAYTNLLAECIRNGLRVESVIEKITEVKLKSPITMEYIKESGNYQVYLPVDEVFDENVDWSKSADVLKYLSYYDKTFSKTPLEHLPEGFDPKLIFENGKSIGLNIDKVHNRGYTGKGVGYAIIDSCIGKHNHLKFKEYHTDFVKEINNNEIHGAAVSSVAQDIAPDADCYYYAREMAANTDDVVSNLKAILEKNKSLPDDKKIRIVSVSFGLDMFKGADKVVKELEKQGVWVFYSGSDEDMMKGYLEKKNPAGDINDFNNYQVVVGNENTLYVNSGDRTVADPNAGPDAYRHDSRASQSWSIPVIAGYYVLACQADPKMTKEKFLKYAEETAHVVQSTLPVYEENNNNSENIQIVGRTKETIPIKIIDIDALINKIEQTR